MRLFGGVLLLLPLATGLLGPFLAGSTASTAAPSMPPGDGHPLGTDQLGRDVLALVLEGGTTVLWMTAAALVFAYGIGVPLGLATATRRFRRLGATVLRLLDVVLAFPGLLVLMVLAAAGRRDPATLVLVAGMLQLPAVTRIVRAAALSPNHRAVVEALHLQGAPWWRIHIGYVGRSVLGPVLTDVGTRVGILLTLLASANFLGLGLPADSPDWAVLIERNNQALFGQPFAVFVPAVLLALLCLGANLTVDRALGRLR